MKLAVLGSGGWGTALALLLLKNGHEVTLWSYTEKESALLRNTGENPLLKGIPLPKDLKYSTKYTCVEGCGAVVFATPSFAVRETARQVKPYLDEGTVVISVSKGIEKDTGLSMTQIIGRELGEDFSLVALSGPSHAEEVGKGMPTAVVAASESQKAARLAQELFMNGQFRVYTSPDIVGVELGAALKNVIALCAGCLDGLGYGDNTKAALMTRGLAEIARLGAAMGGREATFAGLAGVGDLIVTCTSMHSRNRRAGILIGQGLSPQKAVEKIGAVVEGYYATATAKTLADKLGVEMPITSAAYDVLYRDRDVKGVLRDLMTREKKHEIE